MQGPSGFRCSFLPRGREASGLVWCREQEFRGEVFHSSKCLIDRLSCQTAPIETSFTGQPDDKVEAGRLSGLTGEPQSCHETPVLYPGGVTTFVFSIEYPDTAANTMDDCADPLFFMCAPAMTATRVSRAAPMPFAPSLSFLPSPIHIRAPSPLRPRLC